MITDEQLKTWQAIADKATPGPWYTVDHMWLPRGINTDVIAGHHDPHLGASVLDAVRIDGSRRRNGYGGRYLR